MTVPVSYSLESRSDIAAAYQWYENESQGLGERFLNELPGIIDGIRDNPQLYGRVFGNVRAVRMKRFPYVVYYIDRSHDVAIVAVQHGQRSWRSWQNRTF